MVNMKNTNSLAFQVVSEGASLPVEVLLCDALNGGMPLNSIPPERGVAVNYASGRLQVRSDYQIPEQRERAVSEVLREVSRAGLRLRPYQ